MQRRLLLSTACAALALCAAPASRAQAPAWPTQPVKIVVPVASGLIAGESLMGIVIAALVVMGVVAK